MLRNGMQALRVGILTPVRTIGRLYQFGRLLDDYADATLSFSWLHPEQTSKEERPVLRRQIAIEERDSKLPQNSYAVPATASQVYHAALLNGTTLDNLLDSFESSNETAAVVERNPSPVGHETRACYKCDQSSNSSIQSTPERMIAHPSGSPPFDNRMRNISSVLSCGNESSNPQVRDTTEDPAITHPSTPITNSPRSICITPSNEVSFCSESNLARNYDDHATTSPQLKGCPTFLRRQTQSKLPRRSEHATKPSLPVMRSAESLSSVYTDKTPRTRNKLQRKHRPLGVAREAMRC